MTTNRTKTLIFTTLDTSQLKKLIIMKVFIVQIFHIDHANVYIEEKNGNKYLIFDSTDENKELMKKCNDVLNGINSKIKEVSSNEYDYVKDYMKIKFSFDDDLPLNKPLKFHLMTIIVRCVFG